MSAVSTSDRYKKAHPCPICGGSEDWPKHHLRRCTGFRSKDGEWARCSRDEYRGDAPIDDKCSPPVYVHKLRGPCKCGETHGEDNRERWPDPVAEYEYRNASGELLHKKVRFPRSHKVPFIWKHREGEEWKNGRGGHALPYNLPALVEHEGASPVYLVEGEKDVETLRALGYCAITNPDGAGKNKWAAVASVVQPYLTGLDLVILADADEPGRPHAWDAFHLFKNIAKSITPLECTKGKDITDHLEAGGTFEELIPLKEDPKTNGHTNGFATGVSFRDATPPPDEFFGDEGSGVRSKPPFAILTARDMCRKHPKISYVVPDIGLMLGAGQPHMVAGYWSSGKTIILQSLLLSLLAKRPAWDAARSPGFPLGDVTINSAIHIDCEQGPRLTEVRYQRLARGMGIDLASLALECVPLPELSFNNPDHRGHWEGLMKGRDIMVVDSLGNASGDADLNDSKVAIPIMKLLGELSDLTGCRIVLVYHLNKPAQADLKAELASDPKDVLRRMAHRIRGSGAIPANVDAGWGCIGCEGEPIYIGQFRARTTGRFCEPWSLVLVDTDENGKEVPYVKGEESPGLRLERRGIEAFVEHRQATERAEESVTDQRHIEKVREALRAYPRGLGTIDLAAVAKLSKGNLRRALLRMGAEVQVETHKDGRITEKVHRLRGG